MSGSRIWILLYPCSHSSCSDSTARQHPGTIHKQPSARTLVRIQRRRKTNQTSKIFIDKCSAGLMFENCFPNTLDTTVHFDGDDDTFVYTGDIHAMWLRDSELKYGPYVQLANQDPRLKKKCWQESSTASSNVSISIRTRTLLTWVLPEGNGCPT